MNSNSNVNAIQMPPTKAMTPMEQLEYRMNVMQIQQHQMMMVLMAQHYPQVATTPAPMSTTMPPVQAPRVSPVSSFGEPAAKPAQSPPMQRRSWADEPLDDEPPPKVWGDSSVLKVVKTPAPIVAPPAAVIAPPAPAPAPAPTPECTHTPVTRTLVVGALMQEFQTDELKDIPYERFTLKFPCRECSRFVLVNVIFAGPCYRTGKIHVEFRKFRNLEQQRSQMLDFTSTFVTDEFKAKANALFFDTADPKVEKRAPNPPALKSENFPPLKSRK